MKEYNTYIFDLDGTLLNTLGDLAASTNYALRWAGMPEHTTDDVRRFVGNGVKKLMERAIPDGLDNPLFEETYAVFRDHYLAHSLDTTCPYPGIIETIAQLQQRGKRKNIRKKPATDTVYEEMKELNVEKETAVYIGDSDVDINTAKNSGLPCISVLWGFRDKDFLIGNGATTFISKPIELLDY